MQNKKTILTISDHPMHFSGVAVQTRHFIQSLLDTGKYKVISLGGAKFHNNPMPVKTEEYGDDFIVYPVEGYGTQDLIRSVLKQNKIDLVWFMTDPRYWEFLFQMEDEIRPLCPMVYYHVWDNYPVPDYNKPFYQSCDTIASISRLTHDVVSKVTPDKYNVYIPHTTDFKVFKDVRSEPRTRDLRSKITRGKDKFVVLWANRNQKRKMPGDFMFAFKEWLNKTGQDNATLVMKTLPIDMNSDGYDLLAIKDKLGLSDEDLQFVTEKLDDRSLASLYSSADLFCNIANAEGFGMTSFEALACGTPILVNMTGGLKEQVTDGNELFGFPVYPSTKTVIGNPQTPYVYEDVCSHADIIKALDDAYFMWKENKKAYFDLGKKGAAYLNKNYSFESFSNKWIETIEKTLDNFEKNKYAYWEIKEI